MLFSLSHINQIDFDVDRFCFLEYYSNCGATWSKTQHIWEKIRKGIFDNEVSCLFWNFNIRYCTVFKKQILTSNFSSSSTLASIVSSFSRRDSNVWGTFFGTSSPSCFLSNFRLKQHDVSLYSQLCKYRIQLATEYITTLTVSCLCREPFCFILLCDKTLNNAFLDYISLI